MKINEITSCHLGPELSPEQFVPEHVFLYLARGTITAYDGTRKFALHAGEYCLVCKNHLARYNKQKEDGQFEKVVVVLDEVFLTNFYQKHAVQALQPQHRQAFVYLTKHELIPAYVHSLLPYYQTGGKIDDAFSTIKREELLMILLKTNPHIASVLFDFGLPEKIDLEAYMNQNYKFNVSMERFAYLTGRSLSTFKRDFKQIFRITPGRWLTRRRLQEAHFLIQQQASKPIDFYLDLGFEDLSHFSYAFKKEFGYSPSELLIKTH